MCRPVSNALSQLIIEVLSMFEEALIDAVSPVIITNTAHILINDFHKKTHTVALF